VLFYTSEDDPADTIRPRLEATGADLSRVLVVPPVVLNEWKIKVTPPFALPGDVKILYDELANLQTVKLIILDPFEYFLEDKLTQRGVRDAVAALANVARNTGVAIVLVRHVGKAGRSSSPMNAGLGFKSIIGQARAAYLVAPLPSDKDLRVLAPLKVNVAKEPSSIAYRLVDVPDIGAPRVEWQGEVDITAGELLRPPRRPSPRRDVATDFLRQFLSDGPKPVQEVKRAAAEQGISAKTLRIAREELMVFPDKQGFAGPWSWGLPKLDDVHQDDSQDRRPDLAHETDGQDRQSGDNEVDHVADGQDSDCCPFCGIRAPLPEFGTDKQADEELYSCPSCAQESRRCRSCARLVLFWDWPECSQCQDVPF
jgi:hypothetical protein